MGKKGFLKNNDEYVLPITRGELVFDSSGKPALRSEVFLASSETHGLMSSEDKCKLSSLAKPFTLRVNNTQDPYIYTGMEELEVKLLSGNNITLTKLGSDITVSALDEKVKQVTTDTDTNYSVLFAVNDELDVTGYTYKSSGLLYNPNTETLSVPNITGVVSTAKRIYTEDSSIGSASNPVYVDASGNIIPCSATVGGVQELVMAIGNYKQIFNLVSLVDGSMSVNPNVNIGGVQSVNNQSVFTPVYVLQGAIRAASATIGSANKPVYLNVGAITPITIPATTNTVYLMGIDTTNNMYSGTQTSEGVRLVGGNKLYAYQGFFESSDARLKNFKDDITVDLEKLCSLPKKYFTWKSDKTNQLHLGTSAQELQKLYPELVESDDNGFLQVSYEKLSIIALSAIDTLYRQVTVLNNHNSKLEERINQLEQIIYGKS